MFQLHSITGRIAVGLLASLVIGIIVLLIVPIVGYPMFGTFALGTVMMIALMSIMIAFVGQFDRHPVFKFKMHWYLRGPFIGFVFTLMYLLLSYSTWDIIMQSPLISWMGLVSPFWVLIDGMVIGAILAFLETTFAGEGSDLPLK